MADYRDFKIIQRGRRNPKRVIADAYKWASGEGNVPKEIRLAMDVDRWGVMAVMNRPVLYAYEINRIRYAEKVVKAYNARENATNAAEFAADNQDDLQLLQFAENLVNNG